MKPCTDCGACCASEAVSFHASELASAGGTVPDAYADPVTGATWRLRGTDAGPPRCAALRGDVGRDVRCAIYPLRPGPCRAFDAHGVLGAVNPACNDARRRHGLPPLTPG